MKSLIVANWKMNPVALVEAKKLFVALKNLDAVICPPACYLDGKIRPSGAKFKLGAQNCHWEEKGAHTGEISPKMLKDLGVEYVIVGHSERRIHFQETDEMINKKLKAVLKIEIIPILCVGEKEGENAKTIVEKQLNEDLKDIAEDDIKKIIIAYEPIWAIGTGNFCDSRKAQEVMNFTKSQMNNSVLYGGSVNSKISADYIKVGFDGLLVGGASLDAEEFGKIVKNAQH
jgi:triosephosphate isomerase (TIM)